MSDETEAEVILAAGRTTGEPKKHPTTHGRPYAIVPGDCTLQYLQDPPANPQRATGTVRLLDVPSFVKYVGTMKGSATRIYANQARFIAVFNDHEFGLPGYRDLRADFTIPQSPEWMTWVKSNGQRMTQLDFAQFVELNMPDVVEPSGAELLELALNFEAAKEGAFRSAARLQDGSVNFMWVDETKAKEGGGQINVPAVFHLRIPVFENEEPVDMHARFKYRISDGKLTLWYELVRPARVLNDRLKAVRAEIEKIGVPVLFGTPE